MREKEAAQQAESAAQASTELESAEQAVIAATSSTPEADQDVQPRNVSFSAPLVVGSADIVGRSIEELVQGSPLYPPIEGLPESIWKDQSCSNCHQWTKEALCDQSQVYIGANAERSLQKQHPYGGSFKQNLRVWADGGCP